MHTAIRSTVMGRFTINRSKKRKHVVMDTVSGLTWQGLPTRERAEELIRLLTRSTDDTRYPLHFVEWFIDQDTGEIRCRAQRGGGEDE